MTEIPSKIHMGLEITVSNPGFIQAEELNEKIVNGPPPDTSHSATATITSLKRVIVLSLKGIPSTSESAVDEGVLDEYTERYLRYLESQIAVFIKRPSSQALLKQLFPQNEGLLSIQEELSIDLLQSLEIAASVLRSDQQSINDICAKLVAGQHSQDIPHDSRIEEPCQNFVFEIVSWITMLYTPALEPTFQAFEMQLEDPTQIGSQARTEIWKRLKCQQAVGSSLPLSQLLCRFGAFTPPTLHESRGLVDRILAANLSYYTLLNIGHIGIFWVDSISLHLEFDERTLQLKVFRHPSFCAMFCRDYSQTKDRMIFGRIFGRDTDRDSRGDESSNDISLEHPHAYSSEFFLEVLCSYRLLFGQHSLARKAFGDLENASAYGSIGVDPLLKELCSTSRGHATLCKILDDVPPRAKPVYSATSDFPFLGNRILHLQEYIEIQDPSDLKTLWFDRRDVLRFYTFWAVVFVGGVSITLSAIQTVLTGLQLAKK